jgi:hypothetical protein
LRRISAASVCVATALLLKGVNHIGVGDAIPKRMVFNVENRGVVPLCRQVGFKHLGSLLLPA